MENLGTKDLSHFSNYTLDSSGCSIRLSEEIQNTADKVTFFASFTFSITGSSNASCHLEPAGDQYDGE